jgi:hypothetical protein
MFEMIYWSDEDRKADHDKKTPQAKRQSEFCGAHWEPRQSQKRKEETYKRSN